MTLIERFYNKFIPEPNSGCWLWIGCIISTGYGNIALGKRQDGHVLAHRLSYELHKGPIPNGLVIDHLCRTHSCVNPAHLEGCCLSRKL